MIFNKVKYSDRNILLLPKNSTCVADFQKKIPEMLLETFMDLTLDLYFLRKMNEEKIYAMMEIMNRKKGLTAMLSLDSATEKEVESLGVADGMKST